jgi:NAD(P)-dependent dehydrogenase (short-subunit alcohol dehydrogenase family)
MAAARGDRVAVMARNVDRDMLTATLGPASLAIVADVSDPESVTAAVQQVCDAWGGVDVLINNAGLHRGGKIGRLPLDDWDAVLATNLSGPLHCVRAVLPHMGESGSIVNVGAVVGFRGFSGDSAYGSSKAGLAGLTQVLAIELAPRLIRVNLVVPGFVITEMTQQIDERARELLMERIPLRRAGTEDEMAEVIWWVAGSTYMTGSVIPTDGGLMSAL